MDLNWLYKRGMDGLEKDIQRLFRDFIRHSKADIIHAHNMHYFSRLHAQVLAETAQRNRVPLILTAHNAWDEILSVQLLNRIPWAHVIAVSHFIKKELIGTGYDDKRITVIHHGIDTRLFRPNLNTKGILKKYPQLRQKRIIFHPARMGLAKGCDISVKALRLIKKRFPDAILVMAGTKNIIDWGATQQKDIAYIVELIKALKLEKNILIDMFALDEIAEVYNLAQVCIYPSTSPEPFGLTMLESLSSAKPIIVTNMGGMPEIIQDGINGFVIRQRDFETLASKATLLLEDTALRNRLGTTGRQIVLAQYRKERMAKETLDVYQMAIN